MSTAERVMLYAVALVLVAMLLLDRGPGDATSETVAPRPQMPARQPELNRPESNADRPVASSPVPKPVAPVTETPEKLPGEISRPRDPVEPIVIQDAAGHPRIELLVSEDGQAQLVLRDSSGVPGVILAVDADGDSVAKIIRGDRMGSIMATRDGELSLTLTNKQSGIEAVVSDDGGSHVLLTGLENAQAAMLVEPNGDAEVHITGSKSAAEAIMRVLNDGLGQITVRGKDLDDGPNMMRLADGVSILATQLPGGQPGGSMVTSPDGTSVIAVKSVDGKKSASLRMNSAGKAEISATEPGKR